MESLFYFRGNKVMTITWSNIDMDLLIADSIYLTLGGRQIQTVVDYRTNFYTIRDITVLGTINRQVRYELTPIFYNWSSTLMP